MWVRLPGSAALVSWGVSCGAITACTGLLGIDGDYVTGVDTEGRAPDAPDAGPPADAAPTGAGGSGGAPPVDAGAKPPPCKPGTYTGTFEGTLQVVAPVPAKGTIEFRLVKRDATHLQIASGATFAGSIGAVGFSLGTLTATPSGTVDCALPTFEVALKDGDVSAAGFLTTSFTGDLTATYDPTSGALGSGAWTARFSTGNGSGSFSVTFKPGP